MATNKGLPEPPDFTPVAHVYQEQRKLAQAVDGLFRTGYTIVPSATTGSATVDVTFDRPMPDANYQVVMTPDNWRLSLYRIQSRSSTGFQFIVDRNGAGSYGLHWVAIQ